MLGLTPSLSSQGKYLDFDRMRSKALQSEMPRNLQAGKKGSLAGKGFVWTRLGGLNIFLGAAGKS